MKRFSSLSEADLPFQVNTLKYSLHKFSETLFILYSRGQQGRQRPGTDLINNLCSRLSLVTDSLVQQYYAKITLEKVSFWSTLYAFFQDQELSEMAVTPTVQPMII